MGKAKRFNSYDSTVAATRNQTESFGQGRQNVAGYPSGFGMTAKGKTQNNKNVNTLSLQNGGELRGPIGFTAEVGNISATNVLDLTISGAATVKQVRGLIFVSSSTSATLDEIVGKKYNGQIVILTGVSGQTAITITHGSGNAGQILCPGDVNYTLSNDESIILMDDVTAATQSWRIISASNTASGGISNLVEDTTPQLGGDLDGNGFDINMDIGKGIYFDGGVDTFMVGSAISGRINVFNNNVNVTAFGTFGLLTTNITCANITTTGDIDVDGNYIILDSDGDTLIESSSDDDIQIVTGGTTRCSISNTGFLMASPITMLGYDIFIDAGKAVKSRDSQEICLQVTNDSITTGTEGTIQLPWLGASSSTKAAADTDFGNATACCGINEIGGTPTFLVRKSDGSWWGVALTSFLP